MKHQHTQAQAAVKALLKQYSITHCAVKKDLTDSMACCPIHVSDNPSTTTRHAR